MKIHVTDTNINTLLVQVNGKTCGHIQMVAGAAEKDIVQAARLNPATMTALEGKRTRKVVIVPNKLVNIISAV
jgi:leucyl-tRNA synthetase